MKLIVLLVALIFSVCAQSSGQTFPLAGGFYSYNCNGSPDEATYWLVAENKIIIKYSIDMIDRRVITKKQVVEKFQIVNNKLILQLQNLKDEKKVQHDLLDYVADGKSYRTMERAFGDEKFISNGRFIKENVETESLNRCEPTSPVAINALSILKPLISIDSSSKAREEKVPPQKNTASAEPASKNHKSSNSKWSIDMLEKNKKYSLNDFDKSQQAEICKNGNVTISEMDIIFSAMGNPFRDMYRNGQASFRGTKYTDDGRCLVYFSVNGIFNGNSIYNTANCWVNELRMNSQNQIILAVDLRTCSRMN